MITTESASVSSTDLQQNLDSSPIDPYTFVEFRSKAYDSIEKIHETCAP